MDNEQLEKDFEILINKRNEILELLVTQSNESQLIRVYQSWFTEAVGAVKSLIPDRISEFKSLYWNGLNSSETIKGILETPDFFDSSQTSQGNWVSLNYNNPRPNHFMENPRINELKILHISLKNKIEQQFAILESARRKLKSSLMNIESLTQADLFESELEMAKELQKNGFLRAAGAVTGVVLESHLKAQLIHANIKLGAAKTLSKYNDLLKKKGILDKITWRKVQHLIEIRNKCCHKDKEEPTSENISELINGVCQITKEVVLTSMSE